MKLRTTILCILLCGASQAYGAVSGDWQPERFVGMNQAADHPSQRPAANNRTRASRNDAGRVQSRTQRSDDMRPRARRGNQDDQRVVTQPTPPVQQLPTVETTPTVRPQPRNVPEIDGRHAGLALALIMAIFLVTRELRAN